MLTVSPQFPYPPSDQGYWGVPLHRGSDDHHTAGKQSKERWWLWASPNPEKAFSLGPKVTGFRAEKKSGTVDRGTLELLTCGSPHVTNICCWAGFSLGAE